MGRLHWLAALLLASAAALARDYVGEQPTPGAFPLAPAGGAADVYVADDEPTVARIAAGDLALDVERVTGRRPGVKHTTAGLSAHAVLVGVLGRSPWLKALVDAGRLDAADVAGRWETFVIQVVADPLPGVARGLVIAGSDRRGAAYGVYELSRRIGVSPWYWWADVTPRRRAALYVAPERVRLGPAVKYRGLFVNDEMWSIRPWAEQTFAPDEGRGLGPKTYAKLFELLLRLRANYLWPAMQSGTTPFNCYPRNKEVADDYAIVMGSSHIEPMLRNNMGGAEWDREGGGDWNYETNAAAIGEYWARRLTANGKYENVYTLGMRGRDDEPMKGGANRQQKIALMERIFADQRALLARHVNPDPAKVPQAFIPYTEVLGLYDAGLKVPDDVMICWPDDNFGYLRRLPTPAEQARPGGSGVYYHLQWLNGATDAYTWLYTTPLALVWEELHKAFEYGARQLWVVNVGGLKPREIGAEFCLELAWDPARWRRDNTRDFLVEWAARDLDERLAPETAAILTEHCRLAVARRPEHLVQYGGRPPVRCSWFSHEFFNDEAQQRLDAYLGLARRAQAVYEQLPPERRDAFFQLVLYPVQCAALHNERVLCADKSLHYAAQGRASAAEYAARSHAAADRIRALTAQYNTGLSVGAKWNRMMPAGPGPWGAQGYQFRPPPVSDFAGEGPATLALAPEGGQPERLADLSVYTQGRRFLDLFNKGRGALEWTATTSHPWLLLDRAAGRCLTEQRLWVSVDWAALPRGAAPTAWIEVASNGGRQRVAVPLFNPAEPAREAVVGFVESHGYVSMEARHWTRQRAVDGAGWQLVAGLGRTGGALTVFPTTVPSYTEPAALRAHSPALEYDFHLFGQGECQLHVDGLPTQPVAPGRGVRLAVGLDGGEPQVLSRSRGDVLANLRRWVVPLTVAHPGLHTLTVWMVDPGVVLDKLVLYTAAPPESCLGPPESYHRQPADETPPA